jgi:1,4-alpha-glucan branching enzyme
MGGLMAAPAPTIRRVIFKFEGWRAPNAKSIGVVGPFNRWDTSVHRLELGSDGVWSIEVTLAAGEYPYLFIVDGVPWNDPRDDRRVPCEWGGDYSIRIVR